MIWGYHSKRDRKRLIASCGEFVSAGFDLLGCGTPTATLASEIQPAEKGRITSLSILCLILSKDRWISQLEFGA